MSLGRWILLVEDSQDDEALMVRAIRSALGKEPERDIHIARDGREAIELLATLMMDGPADAAQRVVLLDLNMPGMHGLDVLACIRADPRTRCLPVVVLTSSFEACDVRRCYELGANSFIRKPREAPQFLETVERVASYWLGMNQCAASC